MTISSPSGRAAARLERRITTNYTCRPGSRSLARPRYTSRHSGYRPANRYIVFQVLPHTLGLGPEVWRARPCSDQNLLQKPSRALVPRPPEDLLGRPDLQDLPLIQEHHA